MAIDSTRIAAHASPQRTETVEKLRAECARLRREIRRRQQTCNGEDPNETPGLELPPEERQALEERLEEIPRCLQSLKKAGLKRRSVTDPDSRYLRDRKGFTLGHTGALAVSEDHLIVARRVGQGATDNASLLPLSDRVEERCGERAQRVSADSGFLSLQNLRGLEARGVHGYAPDCNLAREMNGRGRCCRLGRGHQPQHHCMRRKLRDPVGRAIYQRLKATVEPVWGTLKEQRGLRRFRRRGLAKVAVEMALAATAYNLTRLWRTLPDWARKAQPQTVVRRQGTIGP